MKNLPIHPGLGGPPPRKSVSAAAAPAEDEEEDAALPQLAHRVKAPAVKKANPQRFRFKAPGGPAVHTRTPSKSVSVTSSRPKPTPASVPAPVSENASNEVLAEQVKQLLELVTHQQDEINELRHRLEKCETAVARNA